MVGEARWKPLELHYLRSQKLHHIHRGTAENTAIIRDLMEAQVVIPTTSSFNSSIWLLQKMYLGEWPWSIVSFIRWYAVVDWAHTVFSMSTSTDHQNHLLSAGKAEKYPHSPMSGVSQLFRSVLQFSSHWGSWLPSLPQEITIITLMILCWLDIVNKK